MQRLKGYSVIDYINISALFLATSGGLRHSETLRGEMTAVIPVCFFQYWYMYEEVDTSSKHLCIMMQFNTITMKRTQPDLFLLK